MRRGTYGQRRAWGQSQLLSLGEGERRTDVKLRLWKYAVIGGTVVDEAGEPVVGVAVRALVKDVVAGRAQFGNMEVDLPSSCPRATTDDRGMFRLSQLTPGTYVVVVPSTQTTLPARVPWTARTPALRQRARSWRASAEVAPLGQPRTQQVGDAALHDAESRADSSAAVSRRAAWRCTGRRTFRPRRRPARRRRSRSRPARSARTSRSAAAGAGGARVRPPGHAGRLGAAADDHSAGRRGDARRRHVGPADGPGDVGFETVSGMSDAAGRFTLLGVPPGEYVLKHAGGFSSRAHAAGPAGVLGFAARDRRHG